MIDMHDYPTSDLWLNLYHVYVEEYGNFFRFVEFTLPQFSTDTPRDLAYNKNADG